MPGAASGCARGRLALALGGPLKADQATDQGIVARMRRGGMLARQQGIQPLLWLVEAGGNGIAQAPQPRRPDRDEQRGNGLEPSLQLIKAGCDQVVARKVSRFHGRMVPAMRSGGQSVERRGSTSSRGANATRDLLTRSSMT